MAGAGWCGMVMTDAKTPPVAFCQVWAYSFSYGQDSGVSSRSDLQIAASTPTDANRCKRLMADADQMIAESCGQSMGPSWPKRYAGGNSARFR